MTRRWVAAAAALGAAAAVALYGCGVTAEDTPRGINPPRSPFPALAPSTTAGTSGAVSQTLYLVKGDRLVAVTRHVESPPTPTGLVTALVAGPTDSERQQGLTSALLAATTIAGVRAAGDRVMVELAGPVEEAPRTDAVLAYAQLVCTLAAIPTVTGVTFTRDGEPVGVPRADGSLSEGPLTAADYASLIWVAGR